MMAYIPPRRKLQTFGLWAAAIVLAVICLSKLYRYQQYLPSRASFGQDGKAIIRDLYREIRIQPELEPAMNKSQRANAAFVILARNSDLDSMVSTLKAVESRFNRNFGYPYVFLNNEPFSEHFKNATSMAVRGSTQYGQIAADQWSQHPSWIDEEKATDLRKKLAKTKLPYADSVTYREMCRYQSGYFFRHELVKPYDYAWRLEPGTNYTCDIAYDPFVFMQSRGIKYSFFISIKEYPESIPTLWDTTKNFTREHPHLLPESNAASFLSDDGGLTYNNCHFWNNGHISDLSLWRSEAYLKYFDYLDKAGSFFYTRLGDAVVQTVAASLLLRFDQIHFFGDFGYSHEPWQTCPRDPMLHTGRCLCDSQTSIENHWWSCVPNFLRQKAQGQAPRRTSIFD